MSVLKRNRLIALCCGAAALLTAVASNAAAQNTPRGPVHYPHSTLMPPGSIARDQLTRSSPLRNYFQPVELHAPQGATISLVVDGQLSKPEPAPVKAGMLIGHVYRFRVQNIPLSEGFEVYPTIELVNRLYPPQGKAAAFPIPIHLTQEELEMAIAGRFVTRIIYLEDPNTALPRREEKGFQRYFEVSPTQDPLRIADDLGRPMAILRMGSRIPSEAEMRAQFTYGSPPLKMLPATPAEKLPAAPDGDGGEDAEPDSAVYFTPAIPRTPPARRAYQPQGRFNR